MAMVQSWPLDAFYDFPSYSPSANEIRRLVALKDSDTCERRKLELQRRASALDSIRLESPCTFVLREYHLKKRLSEKWVSSPFYTNPQGYKLCLVVYANGTGRGSGTYVSVFVHLMWGEYDYVHKWPFQGEITVKLLDMSNGWWKEDKSILITCTFNQPFPTEYNTRVESGEMKATGRGDSRFISQYDLRRYLTGDGSLHFQISSATSE